MFLMDYVIFFIIFVSVFFGLSRGAFQEIISSFFWLFNFYFFDKYNYFNSFYIDACQNIFLKYKALMLVIFFFIKKILNSFTKKIIQKIHFSFFNIIFGGLFGILRSLILVYCILLIIKNFSISYYNHYIESSIVIIILIEIKNYFLLSFL